MYWKNRFLDKESLLALYYSYINSYQNYANLALGSTYRKNLKKLRSQQKHAIQKVHNRTKYEHTKDLFKLRNVLNLCKRNILSIVVLMHGVRTKTSPEDFQKLTSE